jgi:hypothetical protein
MTSDAQPPANAEASATGNAAHAPPAPPGDNAGIAQWLREMISLTFAALTSA